MATQTVSQAQQAPNKAAGIVQDPSAAVNGATSGALSTLDALSSNIVTWTRDILDRFFPPEQREALLAKVKAFVLANPKISAFLGMNIALTGIPLGLFTLFGLSVAVFSVLGGIIVGLIGAAMVTLTCIGLALVVVFPILMFTTAGACFLFLFGLGGYKILKWASGREGDESKANGEQQGITVGDSLNAITGGRLTGLLDSAEAEREKGGIEGFSDERNPAKAPPQTPKKIKEEPVDEKPTATPAVGKVTKRATQDTTTSAAGVTKTTKAAPLSPTAQKGRADEKKAGMATSG